jgi:hypothetical protein
MKIMEGMTMSEISLYKDDNGRKVYKITNTYTVKTEEFVKVAEGEDPFDIWLDQGGLDYSKINQYCLNEGPHTEAHYAEAFQDGGIETKYLGTVVPEYDEEYKDEIVDYVLDDTIPEKSLETEPA